MVILEEGENIIKIVRRHYLVMVPMILFVLVVTFAPIIIYQMLMSGLIPVDPNIKTSFLKFADDWSTFGLSLWFLILWVVFFIEWTDYYLDLWVITNKRILDIDQRGFFHREVTSFSYNQIQDITVETKGFIETFFKFGTLHVQTAGHNREILIKDAHYPEDARALILKLQSQSKPI